ncbi:hypothetical protein ACFOEY_19755 [Paracandidimonas soli]|uniref:hypothetical protein n=1 Tax=Paracandidimonas soli TaxID=1917182 RepID=UPI0036139719
MWKIVAVACASSVQAAAVRWCGSARTPVEHPDSLHNTSYAAVLDVIGNGEMAGPRMDLMCCATST